jgi:hypothetical protein
MAQAYRRMAQTYCRMARAYCRTTQAYYGTARAYCGIRLLHDCLKLPRDSPKLPRDGLRLPHGYDVDVVREAEGEYSGYGILRHEHGGHRSPDELLGAAPGPHDRTPSSRRRDNLGVEARAEAVRDGVGREAWIYCGRLTPSKQAFVNGTRPVPRHLP